MCVKRHDVREKGKGMWGCDRWDKLTDTESASQGEVTQRGGMDERRDKQTQTTCRIVSTCKVGIAHF